MRYPILQGPVLDGGAPLKAGEFVEMEPADAEHWLKIGILGKPGEAAEPEPQIQVEAAEPEIVAEDDEVIPSSTRKRGK